jgi:DNA-binding IclR family transcriptional regulator
MDELAEEVRGAVSIGVRDRLDIVYLETSRAGALLPRQWSEVGLSHPIVASAIGRAYLAACEPAAREALLNEIRVKTPETWDRHRASVARSLRLFARHGWCVSLGDLNPEIYAVGVPFGQMGDGELIVFNCTVQRDLVDRETLEREVAPRLAAMVSRLRRVAHAW